MTTLYPWNRPPRAQALFYGAISMASIATVALLCAYGLVDATWPEMHYGLYATGGLFGMASLATLLASVSRADNEPAHDQREVALALPTRPRRLAITAPPTTKALPCLRSPYPIAVPRGPHWP